MVFLNDHAKELNAKIVYVGPSGSGKTANLKCVADRTDRRHVGELISLERQANHTAYFDFLPLFLGRIHGYRARLHLYTIPGRLPFASTERMIMKGLDAMVFVVDSDRARMQDNYEAMRRAWDALRAAGVDPDTLPIVFQLNKRDLPTAAPADELLRLLDVGARPWFGASATKGEGVFDTVRAAAGLVLERMMGKRSA
ncbi:gliding-motility protein MglA [bacterium]|nr:gliding-motility protein MglA [bacterium]